MPGELSPLFTWRTAIAKSDLPPMVRLVAFALSLYMNERGGSAWPSIPTLAEDSGCSIATVKRGTAVLEKRGFLICKREKGRPTHYTATVPMQLTFGEESVTQNRAHTEPGPQGAGSGLTVIPNRAHTEPLSSQEHAKNTPSSKTSSPGFTEFWAAYPRKVGRLAAKTAFLAAMKKVGADVLIAGAERLRDDPNLPDEFHIPHATTWLHGGRWDDPPLPRRSNGQLENTTDQVMRLALEMQREEASRRALPS